MRVSRKSIRSASWAMPVVRFADQALTSIAGLVLFQSMARLIDLRNRLERCTMRVRGTGAYSPGQVVLLLVIHLFLGYRRLRDLDYYRRDPLVLRLLGLNRLPSVATLSRVMSSFDDEAIDNVREVVRDLVACRVRAASPNRLTFDMDGSVQSTKSRRIEGTAIGYNT